MAESVALRPSRDALAVLAGWADALGRPDLAFGSWMEVGPAGDDQPTQLPWVAYGPDAARLVKELGSVGLIVPFDWMTWLAGDGRAYREDRARIAQAPPEDLVRLLTSIVRGDRFTEGELLDAYESGLLLMIAQRARILVGEPQT